MGEKAGDGAKAMPTKERVCPGWYKLDFVWKICVLRGGRYRRSPNCISLCKVIATFLSTQLVRFFARCWVLRMVWPF